MIWFQSQVDRLVSSKDAEIERLRKDLEVQTARANNAEDRLLTQAQIQTITPEPEVIRESRISARAKELTRAVMAATRVGQDVQEDKDA